MESGILGSDKTDILIQGNSQCNRNLSHLVTVRICGGVVVNFMEGPKKR